VLRDLLRRVGQAGGARAEPLPAGRAARALVDRGGSSGFFAAAVARMARQAVPPAIVVPIFNAARELNECLAALLAYTPGKCRIVLVDDASTDPAVAAVLDRYRRRPSVEVHRNDRNLGFTRTVNRGIAIAERADVVLLNSDTKVGPRWLENLRLAAYSGEEVATATPLSNNAGAFSAPEFGRANLLPGWLGLGDYQRLVTQASERAYPRVPTGHGFCMYVRRDCIDQIGPFDAEAFPRGYGEENDFCMRAVQHGLVHVVDDATLVFHVRSASFGEAKDALLRAGRAVLDERYPEYTRLVRNLSKDKPLRRARDRVAMALARNGASRVPVRPRMLLVGGMGKVAERPAATPAGWEPLLLGSAGGRPQLFADRDAGSGLVETAQASCGATIDPVVADWLVRYAIEAVQPVSGAADILPLRALCASLDIPIGAS
jgi:GT2 family glycosyltransferase